MFIDFCIVFSLIPFAILGYRDGLYKKCFGILGSVIAMIIATKSMTVVGNWISFGSSGDNKVSMVFGFFLMFILLTTAKYFLYRQWQKSKETGELKLWSHIVGSFLGILQGIFVASILFVFLFIIDMPPYVMRKDSGLYNKFFNISPKVFDYSTFWVPKSKGFLEELKNKFGITKLPE